MTQNTTMLQHGCTSIFLKGLQAGEKKNCLFSEEQKKAKDFGNSCWVLW